MQQHAAEQHGDAAPPANGKTAPPRERLIKTVVEAVAPGERVRFLWDTEIRGFGIKVTPKSARTYILQYSYRGQDRRYTIGRHGDVTADQARKQAEQLRGIIAKGGDPASDRAALREVPSLKEFAARYLAEHARAKKKPKSAGEDERQLDKYILPALGARRVLEIEARDLARLHHEMRATPAQANRCIALLSRMMTLAERWGMRQPGSNPARGVERFRETRRERFLSGAELAALGETLRAAEAEGENRSVIAAIRLLILTGCRVQEIMTAEWSHVDLEGGWLRLPDSKTGAKAVPLAAPAVALLSRLERAKGNPYVCAGVKRGQPYIGIEKAWRRLCERMLSLLERDRMADLIALAESADQPAGLLDALRLREASGLERDDLLPLRWTAADLRAGRLRASGYRGRVTRVDLGPAAVALLKRRRKAHDGAFIFGEPRRQMELREAWDALRRRIGIEPARLHDLRHSFASVGATGGESLMIIGSLLGHRTPTMTARYAHLSDDPRRAAADRIAGQIAAALDGAEEQQAGPVVPLRPAG